MEKINICGLDDNLDVNYRYKMRKLSVKFQKGKTIIDNLCDVAKDLDRDPNLLVSFFP